MCKKQINKQNSYLLLAFFQSGSVPELDMHESKHFLPGQFVHSVDVNVYLDLMNDTCTFTKNEKIKRIDDFVYDQFALCCMLTVLNNAILNTRSIYFYF
jgi:hypothetical protein